MSRAFAVRLVARLGLGLVAALFAWVVLLNRFVWHWGNLTFKFCGVAASALLLAALFVLPVWRGWRGPWSRLAALCIAALGALELHGAWLQRRYRTHDASGPEVAWSHPDTTLDLGVHLFEQRLPALSVPRLRMVQISDLHITEELPPEYYQRVAAEVGALQPDVIVLTGDYISKPSRLPLLERWLTTLPPAKLGRFAVLGNHEYWAHVEGEVRALFTRSGAMPIAGRCVPLPSAGIRVCGTDSPWGVGLERGALQASGGLPFVVLSHTPDNVYVLAELGAFAVLSGHTHGGQARLPLWGAVFVPSKFGRRFDSGHFQIDETHLYVSQGVGADAPALRLWCRPELLVLDLVSGS